MVQAVMPAMESNLEWQMKLPLLQFLTGCGPLPPVHGPGVGDPCPRIFKKFKTLCSLSLLWVWLNTLSRKKQQQSIPWLISQGAQGERFSFLILLPVLLGYNWHTALYKFKVYSIMVGNDMQQFLHHGSPWGRKEDVRSGRDIQDGSVVSTSFSFFTKTVKRYEVNDKMVRYLRDWTRAPCSGNTVS